MKAQDLKIGNFVKPVRYVLIELTQEPPILDCHFKVVGLGDDEIEIYSDEEIIYHWAVEDEIEPIKLTEDWLKKFGFEVKHNGHHLKGILIKYNFKGGFVIDISQCMGFVGLKYVHELQNLYHALTGEELTLKE